MIITKTTSTKHHRQQGEGNNGHAPWSPRCDQCRNLNAGPNSVAPRTRTPFAHHLIAALAIASAALSFMGSVKSGGAPLAVAAAVPFHHASARHGNNIGSIATLFMSTQAMITSSELYPPIVSATSMSPVVPAPLVNNGDATLAHESKLKFKTTRFLQSVGDPNAHDEADHEDHVEEAVKVTQETQKEGENLPWGQVIGATFLVSLATFSGLLIIASISAYRGILKLRGKLNPGDSNEQSSVLRDICIFAFAAGALTATAVFLVLPEALHLIGGEHKAEEEHQEHAHRYLEGEEVDDDENVAAAKFGCATLGGFLLPMIFGIVFHRPKVIDDGDSVGSEGDADCLSCIERDAAVETGVKNSVGSEGYAKFLSFIKRDAAVETGVLVTIERTELELGAIGADSVTDPICDIEKNAHIPQDGHEHCDENHNAVIVSIQESVRSVEKVFINKQLCASILLGDGFHNFSDGMFIAASFKASCNVSISISIVMVTFIHEVAQEMADFILLTRHVGLSTPKALLLNFLSGLSIVFGGIIFLACNPSDEATGVILGMAGGVYLNIAACETLPRIESIIRTQVDRICALLFFIIGTIPIGLVLLNHHHCG